MIDPFDMTNPNPDHASQGKRARKKTQGIENAYADALAKHARAEKKLSRAMRTWDKSRAALRRYEKRLDKLQKEHNK